MIRVTLMLMEELAGERGKRGEWVEDERDGGRRRRRRKR